MTLVTITLAATALCGPVKMQNDSDYPWNNYDRGMLWQAQDRCGQLYPDNPCVKVFRKYDIQDYSVICGKKVKK